MLKINQRLNSAAIKRTAGIVILAATGLLFASYIHTHPGLLTNIKHVGLGTVIVLVLIYSGVVVTNAGILYWSVQICNKTIGKIETLLLTSYSTLVNFFGPLQSGPGFRAIYLRKRHDVSIKSFGATTLLYYGSFGIFSLLMIGYGLQPLLAMLLLIIVLISGVIGSIYVNHKYPQFIKHPIQVGKIIVITALQISFTMSIYFIELRSINHNISLSQAFIYTGAANLALFVSLTPGAIGFRESFLLFSERLHHINTHTILAASVIDRAVYFVFLGLLFSLTAGFHAQEKLKKAVS